VVAKGKDGGGRKVSVDKHSSSDGDKHSGSDRADDHGDSDQGGKHAGSPGGDRDGPNVQAHRGKSAAEVHTNEGSAVEHEGSAVKHEGSAVKHEAGAAKDEASAVNEATRAAQPKVDVAKGDGSAGGDGPPADLTTAADRAPPELAATGARTKRQSSPKQVATRAMSAGGRVGASLGASGNEILWHAESASRRLTSTVTSAVDGIRARVVAASQPVTAILESNGIVITNQLLPGRGAAAADALLSPGPLSAPPTAGPPTGATPASHTQPDPSVQWTVHDGRLAATGADQPAGAATTASNRLGSTEWHEMGPPSPWIGVGPSNAVAAALQDALPPPPRAPPLGPPTSTVGLALTLLFSIFAALFAAGLAAPRAGRGALLRPAHPRPLLFVSALERPG